MYTHMTASFSFRRGVAKLVGESSQSRDVSTAIRAGVQRRPSANSCD